MGITCAAFDACLEGHKAGTLEKVVVISSSMVYECTDTYPSKDTELVKKLVLENKIQLFVAGAAIIGGISMFHKLAYFLLAENERITCAAFDACLEGHKAGTLEKVVVISSSMVYECTDTYPSKESDLKSCRRLRALTGSRS